MPTTQQTATADGLYDYIEREIQLPTPPAIALKILNNIQNDKSGMEELTGIISADPALTAKMLRVANSSFYALKNKVSSIERAVSVLGTNLIKNIALSFVIASDLRESNTSSAFDYDYFWRRAVTTAVTADLISQYLGKRDEDIFVIALLHDIGVLTAYQHHRDSYARLIHFARESDSKLAELEQQEFGFDHQQIALTLIRKWNLPDHFAGPIAYHHHPASAPEAWREKAAIIQVADQISAIYTTSGNSDKVPDIKQQLADKFGLSPEKSNRLFDEAALQSIEILNTFAIEDGGMKPYSQMLQEANEELGRLNISYEQLVLELKEAKEKSERLANELQSANLRLNDLVFTDGLTGLYNHRYFQQTLAREIQRAERYGTPLSLILFDLDFFKKVNDTFGHPTGDQVLVNIAANITACIRPSDVLARYGGEEFAVILPHTDLNGVKVFAARLRRCVANTVTQHEGGEIRVTTSIGATTYQPWERKITREALIKTADRGLYSSKKNGRNTVTTLLP